MVDPGDICRFDIAGEMKMLGPALDLVFFDNRKTIRGWSVDINGTRLLMHWMIPTSPAVPQVQQVIGGMGSLRTKLTVIDWLTEVDYGKPPMMGEESEKGFHMYNERWERVRGDHTVLFAIEPHWVVYGK